MSPGGSDLHLLSQTACLARLLDREKPTVEGNCPPEKWKAFAVMGACSVNPIQHKGFGPGRVVAFW